MNARKSGELRVELWNETHHLFASSGQGANDNNPAAMEGPQ
jgi:hypothetical protein